MCVAGCEIVPDALDVADADVADAADDADDADVVSQVPDADDVPQVSIAALSGEHKFCASRDRNVSVDTDNTCARPSTDSIRPRTDRMHTRANCASMGLCKKHCITDKRSRFKKVATKNPPGVSREPADAQKKPPDPASPLIAALYTLGECEVNLLCSRRLKP